MNIIINEIYIVHCCFAKALLRLHFQKTSRIVATNKTKQISQNPKHLYSIEQLQEKAQSGEVSEFT